jgi:GNAT superfamily N-acetyltransferase
MTPHAIALPSGLRLDFDPAPTVELRRELGRQIDAFNARTVPMHAERFALLLHDAADQLVGGLTGVLSWQWLFVDSLWIDDVWRGQGAGRALLAQAERHAKAQGCHSAWLDTFQASGFYQRLGYTIFGALEDYPPGQQRHFLRKRL